MEIHCACPPGTQHWKCVVLGFFERERENFCMCVEGREREGRKETYQSLLKHECIFGA